MIGSYGRVSICRLARRFAGRALSQRLIQSPAFRRSLLTCGLLSTLLYGAMDVIGVLSWPGYDPRSQAISELSAIGAPTARLLAPLQTIYSSLLALFGAGVWMSAARRASRRWCGGFLIAVAGLGIGWALFPMNLRGAERTAGDAMHLVLGFLSIGFLVGAISTGAVGFGSRFRIYSAATVLMMLTFGALMSADVPRVEAQLPTPWLGVNERIMMASWLIWVAVLSIAMLARQSQRNKKL